MAKGNGTPVGRVIRYPTEAEARGSSVEEWRKDVEGRVEGKKEVIVEKGGQRVEVVINEEVWEKIMALTREHDREIGGVLDIVQDGRLLRVVDLVGVKQTNSPGDVDFDEFTFKEYLEGKGWWNHALPTAVWGIWHSHVNMGVFMSPTDETMARRFVSRGYLVNIVTNKRAEALVVVDTLAGGDTEKECIHVRLPSIYRVDRAAKEDPWKEWAKEWIKEWVQERPPVIVRGKWGPGPTDTAWWEGTEAAEMAAWTNGEDLERETTPQWKIVSMALEISGMTRWDLATVARRALKDELPLGSSDGDFIEAYVRKHGFEVLRLVKKEEKDATVETAPATFGPMKDTELIKYLTDLTKMTIFQLGTVARFNMTVSRDASDEEVVRAMWKHYGTAGILKLVQERGTSL